MKENSHICIRDKESLREYIYADIQVNFGESFGLWKRLNNNKFKLLFFLRVTHYYIHQSKKTPWKRLLQSLSYSFYKYYQQKFCIDIKPKTCIGKGLHLPHPVGIVIHGKAAIGDFCTILQQVTIGNKSEQNINDVATIADNVYLGAGAKILGKCKIGNYAKIGANAVVLRDVNAYAVATGVPANIRNIDR